MNKTIWVMTPNDRAQGKPMLLNWSNATKAEQINHDGHWFVVVYFIGGEMMSIDGTLADLMSKLTAEV